ncbi:VRR-NUC domain-containing protein [Salinibacter altiplanensis]|uniref:VRR-NUC domain-containing protein n=1 Tax=Salinibacter altiplanensis TaxID=1803181 RepID=UPI0018F88F49|nr:VRR-NUC domain-containing protein [Salinibacter altiplanensis]
MSEDPSSYDTANETMSLDEYKDAARGQQTEEEIHRSVIQWAGAQQGARPALRLLFHPPNGGKMPKGAAGKMVGLGMRQGVPDLLLPVPGPAPDVDGMHTGLALELKSPRGRLRPKQAWWLARLESEGWAIGVAWTFGEARTIITGYLDGEYDGQTLDLTSAEPPRHAERHD